MSRRARRFTPAVPYQQPPGHRQASRPRWEGKRRVILDRAAADPTLTRTCLTVLMVIASYSDDTAKAAWPGQVRIAERSGLHKRTVQRAISELEQAGYLYVRRAKARLIKGRWSRPVNRYLLRRPPGRPAEYRPDQRRRYRSKLWKAKAAAWIAANPPVQNHEAICALLGDTRDTQTPYQGGAYHGAGTPTSTPNQRTATTANAEKSPPRPPIPPAPPQPKQQLTRLPRGEVDALTAMLRGIKHNRYP